MVVNYSIIYFLNALQEGIVNNLELRMVKKRTISFEIIKLFWNASKRYPRQLVLSFVSIPYNITLFIITPLWLAKITDILYKQDQFSTAEFLKYLGLLAATIALGIIFNTIAFNSLANLQGPVWRDLEVSAYEKLLNSSYNFHTNTFSGSLVAKLGRFSKAYLGLTDSFFDGLLGIVVNFTAAIVVIAYFDKQIALVVLVLVVVFGIIILRQSRNRKPLRERAAVQESIYTAHLADSLSNMSSVLFFSRQQHERRKFYRESDKKQRYNVRYWEISVDNGSLILILGGILQIIVIGMSAISIRKSLMPISTLIILQAYLFKINDSFFKTSSVTRRIEQSFTDATEMVEILLQPDEIVDKPGAKAFRPSQGEIVFHDVSFQYHEGKRTALFEKFNLQIAPGEKIGLVGHSGSGKTTLTKLLLRLMDLREGQILLDGESITDIKQASVRSSIAYVPQEPVMFHRSIMENIRYGRLDASTEEVKEAARLANANGFIEKLPTGYDTLVGERGMKLSGGQRQRIAIARAILKDAPIVVLDEATSALDSKSEGLIQDALWKLMENKTAIVIAHRLSTIQKMNRIVLIEDGKIKEMGSHQELLAHNGEYASLWAHQSGGFLKD